VILNLSYFHVGRFDCTVLLFVLLWDKELAAWY